MKKQLRRFVILALSATILMVLSVPVALASGGGYHTVYHGETLFSIGRKYGVNPYVIAQVNRLKNPDHIYSGQVLHIPEEKYQKGYDYPRDYNKKPYDGYKRDGYKRDGYKRDGYQNDGYKRDGYKRDGYKRDGYKQEYRQKPSDGYGNRKASYKYPDYKKDHDSKYHVVKRGETLTRIAYRYGVSSWDIVKANKISNPDHIYVGQKLRIPKVYYKS